jgi:hypothetical protein
MSEPRCSVCLGALACPACQGLIEPGPQLSIGARYEPVKIAPPCPHCGKGETWSVKGPDDIFIGQDFCGPEAECDAEDLSGMLNAAYELGLAQRQ